MLATPDLDQIGEAERQLLLATCFRSNHVTMLAPFPHYQRLHDLYQVLTRKTRRPAATCPAPISRTS
jgi:hypothetical protein